MGSNALGSRPFPSVCYGVGRGDPGMEPRRRSSGTGRLTDGGAGAGTAREASWATSWDLVGGFLLTNRKAEVGRRGVHTEACWGPWS